MLNGPLNMVSKCEIGMLVIITDGWLSKPRERLLLHQLLLLLISLPCCCCWCCALLRRPGELWCNSCSLSGGLLATGADTATDLHTPHSALRASHIFLEIWNINVHSRYFKHIKFLIFSKLPQLLHFGWTLSEKMAKSKVKTDLWDTL